MARKSVGVEPKQKVKQVEQPMCAPALFDEPVTFHINVFAILGCPQCGNRVQFLAFVTGNDPTLGHGECCNYKWESQISHFKVRRIE